MIIYKSNKYYQDKATINKAENDIVAYKIQLYNDNIIDKLVENQNENITDTPSQSQIYADLLLLNKPQIYNDYNKIINSKFTSNDAVDNMLIKAKADNQLQNVAEAELKRISMNIDYINGILKDYEIPLKQYQEFTKNQEKNAMFNRKQLMEQIVKSNGQIIAGGKQYQYRQVKTLAESLMQQTHMMSEHEKILATNQQYKNDGKEEPYTHKVWIHTHGGKTTRHTSNHNQKRFIEEPFIIVNDKTFHIDEMMFPCDPRASFSNAFICYCQVDYRGGDYEPDSDTPRLYPTYPKPKPIPTLPMQTLPNQEEPEGEYINIKYLSDNKYGEYYVHKTNGLTYDETTGVAKYKGLIVKDYNPELDFGTITYDEILEHNKQFIYELVQESKAEIIDTTDLWEHNGYYLVDVSEGLYKNVETGKYEYKGLEAEQYVNGNGWFSKEAVEDHNSKLIDAENLEALPDKEFIDVNDLIQNDDGTYGVTFTKFEDVNGVKYYKGLNLSDKLNASKLLAELTKEDIDAHNQGLTPEVTDEPPVKEHIGFEDISKMHQNPITELYTIKESDGFNIVEYNGAYYFKGLKITGYVAGKGFISKNDILNHNDEVYQQIQNEVSGIKKEKINTSDLFYDIDEDGFFIDSEYEGFKIDDNTGKAYYKGLEIKNYDFDYDEGYLTKDEIENHNKQFEEESIDNVVQNKPLDINSLEPSPIPNKYLLPKGYENVDGLEVTGAGLNSKGETVPIATKEAIEEYNKQFQDNEEDLTQGVSELAQNKPLDIDSLEPAMIPGEYLLPKDFDTTNIDTVGSEHNNKGEIVSVATEDAIKEYNNQFQNINENENVNEVIQKKFIDVDLLEDTGGEFVIDTYAHPALLNNIQKDEVTGKTYYNGLEFDYIINYSDGNIYGEIFKENIKKHNNEVGFENQISENDIPKEYIDLNQENKLDSSYGEYAVLDDKIYFDDETNKAYYNGMELKYYNENIGIGYFDGQDAIKHNQSLTGDTSQDLTTTEPIKQYIDDNIEGITDFSDTYYHVDCDVVDVNYNGDTGKWEYQGLELKYYNQNKHEGKLNKKEVEEFNKQIPHQNNKIDVSEMKPVNVSSWDYKITDKNLLTFDSEGNAYYKGLKADYYSGDIAYFTQADIDKHNNNIIDDNEPAEQSPTATTDNTKYIDTSILMEDEDGDYQIDLNMNPDLEKDITFNFDTQNYEYKGLKIHGDYKSSKWGWLDKDEIKEHNKQFQNKNNNKIINIKELEMEGFGVDAYVVTDNEVTFNDVTKQYEFNGLKVEDYDVDSKKGYLQPEEIKEHNQKIIDETITIPNAYYDMNTNTFGIPTESLVKDNQGMWVYNNIQPKMVANGKGWFDASDLSIYNKPLTKEKELLEYINQYDLNKITYGNHKGEYKISSADGATYNENTKKWEWKGSEWEANTSYSGTPTYFYITQTQINQHNKNSKPLKEFIDEYDVIYSQEDGGYLVETFKLTEINGKYYYNGLEVKVNDANNMYQLIPKKDFDEHNLPFKIEASKSQPIKTEDMKKVGDKLHLEFNNKEDYNIFYNEDADQYEINGVPISKIQENSTGEGFIEVPLTLVENHNKKLGYDLYGNKIGIIKSSELNFNEDTEVYSIPVKDLIYNELIGEYQYKGLTVDYFNIVDNVGYISKDSLKKHNQQLQYSLLEEKQITVTDEPVNNSKILKKGKSIDGEQYAIDEDGRAWVIDRHAKYEKEQDELQKKIDMKPHKKGMYGWALPDYNEINSLVLGIKGRRSRFDGRPFKDFMKKKAFPLLDKYYKAVNEGKPIQKLLRDYEKLVESVENEDRQIAKLLWYLVDMESAMAKSPPMQHDTVLVRDGHWESQWNVVGGVFEFEPYSSTTYKMGGAGLYSAGNYKITILAPKGTRGTRMNEQYDSLTGEREWLLPRHTKFKVLEFDEDKHTCTIEIIPEEEG